MRSIPKKVQISRIVEAVRGVKLTVAVLYDQFELHTRQQVIAVLNRKVPTVTLIEMKQEHVRSNPKGGSYEDGTVTTRSFQLSHPTNWTGPARRMAELFACSIQLSHPPSWTGSVGGWPSWSCLSIQLGHPL